MGACVWCVIWTWLQGPRNLSWSQLPSPRGVQALCEPGLCTPAPPAPHPLLSVGQRWLTAPFICHCFACSYWNPFIWQPLKLDADVDEQGKAETCCFQGWILTAKTRCLLQSTLGKLLVSQDVAVMNGANLEIHFWISSSLPGNFWICGVDREITRRNFSLWIAYMC